MKGGTAICGKFDPEKPAQYVLVFFVFNLAICYPNRPKRDPNISEPHSSEKCMKLNVVISSDRY